jgi:transcriptional regulator with XRE-family HTH domain
MHPEDADWKLLSRDKALSCNRELLKYFRQARGWTQTDLARIVGYSPRLIAKAEAGEPIALQTIEDLAEAFSTPTAPVYPEDLVIDPLIKTRELLDNLQHQPTVAWDSLPRLLADDVELQIAGQRPVKPCPEFAQGREQVLKVLYRLRTEVDGFTLALDDVHCLGSGAQVSVWCRIIVPGDSPARFPVVQTSSLLEFHRGKIQRIKLMLDSVAWRKLVPIQ